MSNNTTYSLYIGEDDYASIADPDNWDHDLNDFDIRQKLGIAGYESLEPGEELVIRIKAQSS